MSARAGTAGGLEEELYGEALSTVAEALGEFLVLQPAVDIGLSDGHGRHIQDGFGAGARFAAIVEVVLLAFVR